jgi:Glycosyl hydrolases family 31/Domain of unknown function (DUF5110)
MSEGLFRSSNEGASAVRSFLLHFAAIALLAAGANQSDARNADSAALRNNLEIPTTLAAAPGHTAIAAAATEPASDPVADPRAVVRLGQARFTILTHELIRMEWAADGRFEDHASFVFLNRRLPVPRFEHTVTDGKLTIKTDALTLVYTPGPGDANQAGRFTQENLSINRNVVGKPMLWRPGMVDDQNLMGTAHTLDDSVGDRLGEPMEPGLVSRAGWAVGDDSSRPLFDSADFNFRQGEKSAWPWVMERPAGERQDWYFFGYDHDYKKALGDFVRVAGRIPLPPRFALGTWWSRYWTYSDQEIEEIVKGFHENDVPLDVFVIDMDWHPNFGTDFNVKDESGHTKGWTGYSWNKNLFPDPENFLAKLHWAGLKTSLNLHPASGIQAWEDAYPQMARAMGADPATGRYVPYDITDKKYATNYLNLVLHPLEKQGVDFWWLDWQQEPTTRLPGVDPIWWLNYVHFTDQQREGKRPLLFHRWGGLGNHRYQIGFSGDTRSEWPSLAFQPWFTATAANVGYAYWSHDIGGHYPGTVEPELFTRWVQFGAFSPVLRTHSTKNPDSERRIWAYPEPYSTILRATFQLRHAMQPYLYTEARRTYDTGVAFVRPLYYDWPDAPEAYTSKGEYLFGDEMLVAPVTAPADKLTGLLTENVWLPPGEWIEWPTGKHLAGGTAVKRSFSIDQIPVYVKAGAIVPMQPPMLYTGQKPVDPLIVNVWPLQPGARSNYSVYEDSGASVAYQRGVFARTALTASQSGDILRVEIGPVAGSYPGMRTARGYQLRLPADWPPERVTVNGVVVKHAGPKDKSGWSFEGNTLTTVIPVPAASVETRVTVEVQRAQGMTARRGALDGYAGALMRLRGAYDAMHQTWPVSEPPDALVDAMQSGDRLGYHPEKATEELAHFTVTLPKAQAALDAVAKDFPRGVEAMEPLPGETDKPTDAQKQRRRDSLARALVDVAEAMEAGTTQ